MARLVRILVSAGSLPLLIAVVLQAVGNLIFHAIVGRWLPAGDYGAFGVVLAAMTMLGVPLGALQTAASAHTAGRPPARATAVRVMRDVAIVTLPLAALTVAATGLVQGYFQLRSPLDAAQLGPYLLIAALLATARGLLLGQRKVKAVAVTYVLGTAVRLTAGLALVGTLGVTGALLGTLVGELFSLLVAIVPLFLSGRQGAGHGRMQLDAVGRATFAVTGLFLFSTVDLLLARHHLRGAVSGEYVAAATVSKTALALPAAMMSMVFPHLVTAWRGHHRIRSLASGVVAVVGPAFLGAAVVVAVPGPLLRLLYGDGFADARTLVRILATIAGLTSIVTLLAYAALARGSAAIAVPWAGAIIEVAIIQWRHATAGDVALGSATALFPTLLVIAVWELRAWRRGPARSAQFPPGHADPAGTGMGLTPVR